MTKNTPAQVSRPIGVIVIAGIVFVQAVALIVAAVGVVGGIGDPDGLPMASQLFMIFLIALGAVWLSVTAIGVLRGKTWTRAALVVIELFSVILAFNFFSTGDILIGGLLLAAGAAVLVLAFTSATTAYLGTR